MMWPGALAVRFPRLAGLIRGGEVARYQWCGFAGASIVVSGGALAGVVPVDSALPDIRSASALATLAVLAVYVGLCALLLGWWGLGSLMSRPDAPSARTLRWTLAWWAAPFTLAVPIFSGDVYSYLVQGAQTAAGMNVYRLGPADLGGPLAANVPSIWQHTSPPYGPVFLEGAASVVRVSGSHVWAGILGMRLLAVVAVGMLAWAVPRLAAVYGVSPAAATWLGVLNPLVLLHLVGDAHNDALMLALMCVGLVLAYQVRCWLGAVVITLAALVKAPAAAALVFLVPIWAGQSPGPGRWLRAGARVALTAVTTAVAVTLLAGTGIGWAHALGTPTRARTWMSVSTDLGWAVGNVLHRLGGPGVDQTRRMFWLAGLAVAAAVGVLALRHSDRLGPVMALGVSLMALVLAGPVVHPWYLLWGIVPLAAAAGDRRVRGAVALGSVALVLLVIPGGVQPGLSALVGAVAGCAVVALITMSGGVHDLLGPAWTVVGAAHPGLPMPGEESASGSRG